MYARTYVTDLKKVADRLVLPLVDGAIESVERLARLRVNSRWRLNSIVLYFADMYQKLAISTIPSKWKVAYCRLSWE